jgi:uncharacterized protein (TIGR02996 family)
MPNAYLLPDWELLLKAVAASPGDDLPRLVAADWLDEHGEPERAEFIRVQIERAKADRPELALREQALWNNPVFGPLWAVEACPNIATLNFGASLRHIDVSGAERVTFRRGFPFRVACSAEEWLRHGNGIVPRQPVRDVALSKCDQLDLARWWDMKPTLGGLDKLEVDTTSLYRATWIRDYICPGVPVVGPDGLVEDELVTRWVSGSGDVGAAARVPPRTAREVTPPPRTDTPN